MYDYDKTNKTELVELAHLCGSLHAHRGLDRDVLEALIEGRLTDEDVQPDPVDLERDAMQEMMAEWPTIKDQLSCDLCCWDCPPGKVVSCVVINCENDILERVRKSRNER